ncbi:MAG: histidine phosphatase family protein [Pseudomonadota bacterium]
MTDQIFFVRHARPVVNLAESSYNWPLAPGATDDLAPIVAELSPVNVSKIRSSPENRALSTANFIAASSGRLVETLPDLCEHKRDSLSRPSSDREFFDLMERFFESPDQLVFGLETASEACDRFTAAVREALGDQPGDTIIVGHGTVLSLLLGSISGRSRYEIWRRMKMPDLIKIPRESLST